MNLILENIIALSGIAVVSSVLVLVLSPILLWLITLLKSDPLEKKKIVILLKKTFLFAALLLLVCTGICAVAFVGIGIGK